MTALAMLAGENSGIAYFFESGDRYQGDSQRFIALLRSTADVAKRLYNLRSHAVLDKEDCRLFEMSDILAWEWAKHVERDAKGLPMRKPLEILMGVGLQKSRETNVMSRTGRGLHITGGPLRLYYQRAHECELFSDNPSPQALKALASWASQAF
jgi:hypothetical protein